VTVVPISREAAHALLGDTVHGDIPGVGVSMEPVRKGHCELVGIYDGEILTSVASLEMRGRKAILSMDYTVPSYRRQGRHAVLVRWRIARAKALGATTIEASALASSVRRYLAEGFVITKVRKHGWQVRLDVA
jgi:GNAT superfamily N-acetyltransferase